MRGRRLHDRLLGKTPLLYALVNEHVHCTGEIVQHFQQHKRDFVVTQEELVRMLGSYGRVAVDVIKLVFVEESSLIEASPAILGKILTVGLCKFDEGYGSSDLFVSGFWHNAQFGSSESVELQAAISLTAF